MDGNNDTQHMNTVRDSKVLSQTKHGNYIMSCVQFDVSQVG